MNYYPVVVVGCGLSGVTCARLLYVPFPINRTTINQLFGLNLSIEEVPDFLQKEVRKSTFRLPAISFRDAVVSHVGEQLYALFFEKYTEKQWNCSPDDLSSGLAGRIPVRSNNDCRYFSDKYQGIPVNGYTAMKRIAQWFTTHKKSKNE